MIFQGQEFLEDGYFKDTEELNWEKLNRLEGIDKLSADLIKLRTGETQGAEGLKGQHTEIVHFNQENKILAYKRTMDDGAQPALIIVNFGNRDFEDYGIGVEEDKNWKIKFNSTWKGYDNDFSELPVEDIQKVQEETDEKAWTGKVNIPAYGALIYAL